MKAFIVAMLLLLPVAGWGADGYKNLKWGMSKEAVKKSKLCTFKESSDSPEPGIVDILDCDDFKYVGKKTLAAASFVDNRLLRFSFSVSEDALSLTIQSLFEKYITPSYEPDSEEWKKVYREAQQSSHECFDNDTICVHVMSLPSPESASDVTVISNLEFVSSKYNSTIYDKKHKLTLKGL